jgi:hypothetical protein
VSGDGCGGLLRRFVHLVGGVLEVVLDSLAFLAQRVGPFLGGFLVRAAGLHAFDEVGLGLVGFVDRRGGLLDLVLGLAVAPGQRERGGEGDGE